MYHKLHRDGPGDWCTTELPLDQRSTDKSGLPTTKTGTYVILAVDLMFELLLMV